MKLKAITFFLALMLTSALAPAQDSAQPELSRKPCSHSEQEPQQDTLKERPFHSIGRSEA